MNISAAYRCSGGQYPGLHFDPEISASFSHKGIPTIDNILKWADQLWMRWLREQEPGTYESNVLILESESTHWFKVLVRSAGSNATGKSANWIAVEPEGKEDIVAVAKRAFEISRKLNE